MKQEQQKKIHQTVFFLKLFFNSRMKTANPICRITKNPLRGPATGFQNRQGSATLPGMSEKPPRR